MREKEVVQNLRKEFVKAYERRDYNLACDFLLKEQNVWESNDENDLDKLTCDFAAGMLLKRLGNKEASWAYLANVSNRLAEVNEDKIYDKYRLIVTYHLLDIYLYLGKYQQGLKLYYEILPYIDNLSNCEKIGLYKLALISYEKLGENLQAKILRDLFEQYDVLTLERHIDALDGELDQMLKCEIERAEDKKLSSRNLRELCLDTQYCLDNKKYKEALQLALRSTSISVSVKDFNACFNNLGNVAAAAYGLGRYDIALQYMEIRLDILNKMNLSGVSLAEDLNYISILHQNLGDTEAAIKYCVKALEILFNNVEEDQNLIFLQRACLAQMQRLGLQYSGNREINRRYHILEQEVYRVLVQGFFDDSDVGLSEMGAVDLREEVQVSLQNSAEFFRLGDLDSQLNSAKYAYDLSEEINDQSLYIKSCRYLGYAFFQQRRYEEALEYFEEVIEYHRETATYEWYLSGLLINMSLIYKEKEDYIKCNEIIKFFQQIAHNIPYEENEKIDQKLEHIFFLDNPVIENGSLDIVEEDSILGFKGNVVQDVFETDKTGDATYLDEVLGSWDDEVKEGVKLNNSEDRAESETRSQRKRHSSIDDQHDIESFCGHQIKRQRDKEDDLSCITI